MKLRTHYIFTLALLFLSLSALDRALWSVAVAAAILAATIPNLIIDRVGHTTRGEHKVRTAGTHSIHGALIFGGIPAGVLVGLIYYYSSIIDSAPLPLVVAAAAVAFFLAPLSHLFLDALTEGGIFVNGHRWALAHWRYDGVGNAAFLLLSLLLFAWGLLWLAPSLP